MRTAIYLFYGLDVEIRPKMDPPELFIHLGGAIGMLAAQLTPWSRLFRIWQWIQTANMELGLASSLEVEGMTLWLSLTVSSSEQMVH